MYSILLAVGIHHREMIQRKSMNYERILNIEINKTNNLISKLVPFHILGLIKNEKRQADEFDDLTILNAEIVNFSEYQKGYFDPRDAINILGKLFARFDQLCDENKVYKIHTIGETYILMGYNGRIDKSKRHRGNLVDEAVKCITVGFEMLQILNEINDSSKKETNIKNLKMKIGIHTGKVVGGIIGSKMVRYDVYGEGVLISNKIKISADENIVFISEDTKKLLNTTPDVANEYYYNDAKTVSIRQINRQIVCYNIEKKQSQSFQSGEIGEHLDKSLENSDEYINEEKESYKSQTSRSEVELINNKNYIEDDNNSVDMNDDE